MLNVQMFTGGPFVQNSYLAWREGSDRAVAIDAGMGAPALTAALEAQGLRLDAILLTHAHLDHIDGTAILKRYAPDAPIYLHADDQLFYDNVGMQASQFGVRVEPLPPIDKRYQHGDTVEFAGITFNVTHVPGHAPGHVCLKVAGENVAFVGDVVFQGSIGRTDLPGGDYQQLMRSIREHVMTLPDETRLYCGHGPDTSVLTERTTNPFIAPMYGGSFA